MHIVPSYVLDIQSKPQQKQMAPREQEPSLFIALFPPFIDIFLGYGNNDVTFAKE
jgi:hypothetical protein